RSDRPHRGGPSPAVDSPSGRGRKAPPRPLASGSGLRSWKGLRSGLRNDGCDFAERGQHLKPGRDAPWHSHDGTWANLLGLSISQAADRFALQYHERLLKIARWIRIDTRFGDPDCDLGGGFRRTLILPDHAAEGLALAALGVWAGHQIGIGGDVGDVAHGHICFLPMHEEEVARPRAGLRSCRECASAEASAPVRKPSRAALGAGAPHAGPVQPRALLWPSPTGCRPA